MANHPLAALHELWREAKERVPGFQRLAVSWRSDGSVSIEIWRIPVEEEDPLRKADGQLG